MSADVDAAPLEAEFREMSREEALEAANRAFSWSQENLTQAGEQLGYETYPIVKSGQPPQWDDSSNAARFSYHHPAAYYCEVGTQTHEIVADDGVLAFEWPDAPQEVQEMFESTFPTVFFPSVEVEGIDPIRFVGGALDDVAAWWEGDR